jgi:hypothetical protein
MDSTDPANAMYFIGLVSHDILAGGDGKVTLFGKIRGLNTTGTTYGETWVDGDVLYLDPNVVGGLTKVEPLAGEIDMPIAAVVHAHNAGSLYVRALPFDRNVISNGMLGAFYTKSEIDGMLEIVEW